MIFNKDIVKTYTIDHFGIIHTCGHSSQSSLVTHYLSITVNWASSMEPQQKRARRECTICHTTYAKLTDHLARVHKQEKRQPFMDEAKAKTPDLRLISNLLHLPTIKHANYTSFLSERLGAEKAREFTPPVKRSSCMGLSLLWLWYCV